MSSGTVDLSVTLGKIKLKNPVMSAAGTFGYGEEFADFINLEDLGAIVVKSITLNPRLGSFPNRFLELSNCSFISTSGLQNVGVHKFIAEKLPYLRRFSTPVIVNIGGESIDDYARVAEILNRTEGVDGIEINISCPCVERGGAYFGVDSDATFQVVKAIRSVTDLTVIPKLTPSVTDITIFAKVCQEAGADAISLINGLPAMAIDINTRKSKLGKNLRIGVGGPWIKPFALRMVWQVVQAVDIPVIGIGGITSGEDALEFLIAGATAIQIGTANLIDPTVMIKTVQGIKEYLIDKGGKSIGDIIGSIGSDVYEAQKLNDDWGRKAFM